MTIAADIRTALIDAPGIFDQLGQWEGEPSIHTRRPAPEGATYPIIIIPSENAAAGNQDLIRTTVQVLTRDILIFGQQPDQLRVVDEVALKIFSHFHRQKWSLQIEGSHVLDIVARPPVEAPTSNEKLVGRLVSLQLRLQGLAG